MIMVLRYLLVLVNTFMAFLMLPIHQGYALLHLGIAVFMCLNIFLNLHDAKDKE